MPIVDGFEATKMIRLWEHTSGQPATSIIAVTAHSGPETLNQCLEYGMQDMISKPFQAERLISALQSQNIPMPQIQIRSSK